MKLNIYNWSLFVKQFPQISFTKKDFKKVLLVEFGKLAEGNTPGGIVEIDTVNAIFASSQKIQQLNKDFRKKDSQTDVLSFLLEENPLVGEIYVCPEYISKEYSYEEVLRALVHGFLHLIGYEHSQKFTEDSEALEDMFVKQENMLQNILYEINNRVG